MISSLHMCKKGLSRIKEDRTELSSVHAGETGLPADKSCLKCILPPFLTDSIQTMMRAWRKIDECGDYLHWDCDYCILQSDIDIAEVNRFISPEQAWYLREKYLRIERTG